MQQIEYQVNAFHNTSAETSDSPVTCVMIQAHLQHMPDLA